MVDESSLCFCSVPGMAYILMVKVHRGDYHRSGQPLVEHQGCLSWGRIWRKVTTKLRPDEKKPQVRPGKSRMSVLHNTKSYWLRNTLTGRCGRYVAKEIWPYPGRSHEWLICHSNNESWEVSRAHSSEEVYVMYMERRGESVWSFK